MKSNNKQTILAISIAVLFLTGCNEKKETGSALDILNNVQVDKKVDANADKQTAASPTPTTASTASNAPTGGATSSGPTKRAASYPKNDSSISNQVAIAEIEAGRPYTSIVSEVEGFRSRPYSDVGQGFAVGNGWNMSFQSSANNRAWATKAGIPESMIKSIVSINGRMQGSVPAGIEITPAQAIAVAEAMRPTYEKPAVRLFTQATWDKLKENHKAVLVYHIEKVGPGGAAKYKGLIKAVQTYANSPTSGNAQAVVSHITYGYKIKYPDGTFKQMQDTRSQLYMGALFVDPQQYRYLLGKTTAPTGFSLTAKSAGFDIDPTKAAEAQVAQQDTFHNEIEKLADSGFTPEAKQQIDGKTITYSMATPEPVVAKPVEPVKQPAQPKAQAPVQAPAQAPAVVEPKVAAAESNGVVMWKGIPHAPCPAGTVRKFFKMDDNSMMPICEGSAK